MVYHFFDTITNVRPNLGGISLDITRAKYAGFCFGVRAAIDKLEETLATRTDVYYGNPVVHNDQAMDYFHNKGFKPFCKDETPESGAIFFISAHGTCSKALEDKKDYELVDSTCDIVRAFQELVISYYRNGHQIVILGKRDHPEVRGVVGEIGNDAIVISNLADAEAVILKPNAVLFSQTTCARRKFEEVAAALRKKNQFLPIIDTLCRSVETRINAACELAQDVDAMIVIGSKHSDNSNTLYESVSETGKPTFFIHSNEDIDLYDFSIYQKVGVTAGASAPEFLIQSIIDYLRSKTEKPIGV